MSKIALTPNASGTGTLTIAAPNTSTDRTLTLPDETGTIISSTSNQVAGPAFSAYQASAQSVSNNTLTVIIHETEDYDTASSYDISNGKFQPTIAGYYFLTTTVAFNISAGDCWAGFFKNGTWTYGTNTKNTGGYTINSLSAVIYLNGSSDYVQSGGYQTSGSSQNTLTSVHYTHFSGGLLRAA